MSSVGVTGPTAESYEPYDHRTHVYMKPDTYIGSEQPVSREDWIYNSEENQTYWKILPTSKDPHWNTIGIHQVGRQINAFLNSVYVDSFKLWNTPARGKVGVYFKADPRIGGKAQFQRLAVYEFD